MTPRFALLLSSDGIRLLHRVPEGWNRVGNVPLETDDLPGALAKLRADGLTLEPEGLTTKLVIPEDQIRFMSLEGAQTSVADVRQALDGATPYAVDDLSIDFDRSGGMTHIAAVARETLAEAEAFALDHDFNPVCFVAVPPPGTFVSEVFFGPTQSASGNLAERSSQPVEETGIADLTAKTPGKEAATDTVLPEPPQDPVADTPDAADTTDAPAPEISSDDPPLFTARSRPVSGAMAAAAMPGGAAPGDTTPATAHDPARAAGPAMPVSPAPSEQTDRTEPKQVQKPALTATRATPVAGAPEEPLFTRRKEPPPPIAGKGKAASPIALRAEAPSAPDAVPAMVAAPRAPQAPQPTTKPAQETPDALAGLAPARSGKPRFLGLILTAVLLVVLLIMGFWASTLPDEGIAWLWGDQEEVAAAHATAQETSDETDIAAVAPALQPATPEAIPAPSALTDAPTPELLATPALPVVRAPTTGVLTPAEADRIYAATGVYQRAPRLPVTPRTTIEEARRPVPVALTSMSWNTAPALPDPTQTAPDPVIAAQVDPPAADVVFARDLRGRILATPTGTIVPSGAIVYAGAPDIRPQVRPGTPTQTPTSTTATTDPDAPETVRLIAGTPPVQPRARPADLATVLTQDPQIAAVPDLRPVVRPGDVAPAQAEEADTSDPASPEVTETDAATPTVITGAPDLRPTLRPASFASRSPVVAVPIDPRVADARPALRPEGLAPAGPESDPTPDINAIAAAIASAAPQSAFSNRTARAVGIAPRPATRPRNFDQVVARATAAPVQRQTAAVVQRPATTPQVAAPAVVAPTGPVPGGVARAATQENAIRLRDMNLVGVYGRPNARRALVRLGNGRYVKVEVGSALDGGRVTAIGDSALNFVKRGRTYALQLPTG
ncbi:hypothetical protein SAMN05428995_102225 [Loktanella sp. DSM 29012]|uniref:hypothetical protein n=1 Tax=Loktanella sp. DSM 29012 TaxID=1881056 RepID=UPI0008AEBBC5|nr:hypothetical protein [Loktanella sp. DSM 29012]SEP98500.1 hypothetical protein SAMN05428995_102225 [Loktanella sp. DSM 29012]